MEYQVPKVLLSAQDKTAKSEAAFSVLSLSSRNNQLENL